MNGQARLSAPRTGGLAIISRPKVWLARCPASTGTYAAHSENAGGPFPADSCNV
jgi:hypothetical protein